MWYDEWSVEEASSMSHKQSISVWEADPERCQRHSGNNTHSSKAMARNAGLGVCRSVT
jgi:hypothetical protein